MEENLSAGGVHVPVTQNSLVLEKKSLGSDSENRESILEKNTDNITELKKDIVDIFKSKKTNLIKQQKKSVNGKTVEIFQCGICHKTFNVKKYLKCHLLTHTGIKKFKCEICSENADKSTFPSENTASKHTKMGEYTSKDGKIKKNKKSITTAHSIKNDVRNSATAEKEVTDPSVITNHIQETINSVIKSSLQASNLKKGGERSGNRKKESLKINLKAKRKEKSTKIRQRKDNPDSCTSRNEILTVSQEIENLEREPQIADDVQLQVMKGQETTESTELTKTQDQGSYQTVGASVDWENSPQDFKIEVNDDFVNGTDNPNYESFLSVSDNASGGNNSCEKMLKSYSDSSADIGGKDVSLPCVKTEPIENLDYLQSETFSVEINPFYNNEIV
ncbi:unnamed protein product [Mytilus coruscus]|uniref:C2H2-type domain-containing protein n=1 Tax=Mytilus coruscus TaxID=42192 RepID=A0A6J8DJR8_MYTCO|nr:unnamed protein product [Mytilus coruscus]